MPTPQELKQQIETLSAQKASVDSGLLAKKIEAISLLRTIVVDLLISFREDPNILAKSLVVRKKKAAQMVVFEIGLSEGDLINREDYTATLADVITLASLAGIPPVVVEEK